jgi:hypothetical protein
MAKRNARSRPRPASDDDFFSTTLALLALYAATRR